MEMPGRRSNYTLLSQVPDDTPYLHSAGGGTSTPPQQPYYYESNSGEKNKLKADRPSAAAAAAYDWDAIDQRMVSQQSRIGTTSFAGSFGLQRQSSGSSFGESSVSGDYYPPSLSNPEGVFSHFSDGGSDLRVKATEASGRGVGSSSSYKSWAQQTEESYQLQLALALRLSSEATCADDPNLLDPAPDESLSGVSSLAGSAEAISHRFWVM